MFGQESPSQTQNHSVVVVEQSLMYVENCGSGGTERSQEIGVERGNYEAIIKIKNPGGEGGGGGGGKEDIKGTRSKWWSTSHKPHTRQFTSGTNHPEYKKRKSTLV